MTVPARDSRYVEPADDPLVDERDVCINCALPMPKDARWRWVGINVFFEGAATLLEQWPVCPDCDSFDAGRSLVNYVKFKLS